MPQVLKKMQYQVPKADMESVVYCKAGAIEKVHCNRVNRRWFLCCPKSMVPAL